MEELNTNLSEEPVIISRETILESLRKSILDLGMMPEEKLKEIILDDNIDFVDALFIFIRSWLLMLLVLIYAKAFTRPITIEPIPEPGVNVIIYCIYILFLKKIYISNLMRFS